MNTGSSAIQNAPKASAGLQLELDLCRRELLQCQQRLEQMESFFAHEADAGFMAEPNGKIIEVNEAACVILGYSKEQFLGMRPWDFMVNVSDREILHDIRRTKCGSSVTAQRACRRASGEQIFLDLRLSRCHLGGREMILVSARDVTERMRAEGFVTGQKRLLEMVARGEPLNSILEALCCFIEEMSGGSLCSILLLDDSGKRLRHGAAPSLPGSYTKAIDGAIIGPCCGSCGTAAYRREVVIVSDIARDPLWQDYRDLASPSIPARPASPLRNSAPSWSKFRT
jgi:PAS domain S-box-containing protein